MADTSNANKTTLSMNFRPDVNSAGVTAFGVPALPQAEDTTPKFIVEDIRSTSPEPTIRDLQTPNDVLLSQIQQEKASVWQGITTGAFYTGKDWYRSGSDKLRFERDPNFQAKDLAEQFFAENGMQSDEENEYLNGAVSHADFQNRVMRTHEKRGEQQVLAERPYVAMASGILDIDLAAMFFPYAYGATKVGRASNILARTAQATAGASLAVGVNTAVKDFSLRSDEERDMDTAIFGLVGFLTGVTKFQNTATRTATSTSTTSAPYTPTPPQLTFTPHIPTTGTGVNVQQQVVLPPALQQNLNQATQQTLQNLLPVSRPVGAPTEYMKKMPMLSRMTSSADELWFYTQGDQSTVVNRLLANVHTEGDNVASAQATYLNNYGYLLSSVERALADAVTASGTSSTIYNRVSGKYGQASNEVMDIFQDSLQKLDQAVMQHHKNTGVVLDDTAIKATIDTMTIPEAIKHAIRTYIDSGFATKIYDDAKHNGFFDKNGMDAIVRRPTYMPLQHSYDRMHSLVTSGKATWDEIYDFYGAQISRMYPELLQPNFAKTGRSYSNVKGGVGNGVGFTLTPRMLGQHFISTQKESARGLSDVTTHGMRREVMHDMLTRVGIDSTDASVAVKSIFDNAVPKQSNPTNFRRRMDWDWNTVHNTQSGFKLSMGTLSGGSAYSNLEGYSRRMAHLNGLAQYGLSQQSLKELLEGYIDKAPQGVNPQKVRKFLMNVEDDLIGRPTGGSVSQSIRSAQAIADPMLLANSGIFGVMDVATQFIRVGVIRSFPHIYRGLRASFKNMKGMSKENAKDLEDIFTGKLMQGSRWKNFMTHYSDNFAIESGGIHESAQYYGQSARFLNLSESVKRMQIGILMGTYLRAIRGTVKGGTHHENFLRNKMRMSDELIQGIKTEWSKHGESIDNWNADVRIAMEQKIFHESDNLAYTVQKGEVPAILEYDHVGKVIFPYMRFAFAMNQKVLRRTVNRDGLAGISLLLMAQFPIAMLIASAINLRKGNEADKDLATGTLRAMTAGGIWNYPTELLMNGFSNSSVTALAPFSKTYNLLADAVQGESTLRSVKENSVLNSAVILDPILYAVGE